MFPTRRLLWTFAAGLPLALLPAFTERPLVEPWFAFVTALVLLALADALLLPRHARLGRRIVLPPQAPVGATLPVHVHLDAARWRFEARVRVRLDVSPELGPTAEVTVPLERGRDARADFAVAVCRRGTGRVVRLWLRWAGPLGLVERTVAEARGESVAIAPDVRGARRSALRDLARHEAGHGLRPTGFVGEGSEFESMREYVPGMDPRALSWRASARHRRLVAHEFRAERNHQMVVALDTGRLMRDPVDGLPRLDHAVHAGLRLAHVALRLGDRVGMFAFDERARGFAPPRAGVHAAGLLERFTASLDYGTGETNYTLGLAELAARLTRRSFVVLFTDFVDSITAELMVESSSLLARRHLVAFVALGDPGLATPLRTVPRSLDQVHEGVVAADILRERRLVLRRLERRGLFVVDAAPSEVGEPLLSRYLRIRRREMVG